MLSKEQQYVELCRDERGIPLEDVVLLHSDKKSCVEEGAQSFFVGSFRRHDGLKHNLQPGGYRASVGAVFADYAKKWTDCERIINLLCDTLQAMYRNPDISAEKAIQELRKIDFFYCGAFPQVPGDHKEQEAC